MNQTAQKHRTDYDNSALLAQPFPVRILHQNPWKEFICSNGYVPLAKTLTMKVYSTMSEAETLWNQFSPNKSVFHLWNIRKSFYEGFGFDPYFVTLMRHGDASGEPLGVLPLWFNTNTSHTGDTDIPSYVWFGSNYHEDNVFFVRDPEFIPLLLLCAPAPLEIACIAAGESIEFLMELPGFQKDQDKKFFLDMSRCPTISSFLSRLKKKKRYNLKRDKKRIERFKPQILINHYDHLDELFRLNIARFRRKFPDNPKEYSTFEDTRYQNTFRALVANQGSYSVRLLSTIIDGNIAAVEMGLVYGDTYYSLYSGADTLKYSGIGIYSNLLVLEDAIRLGCRKIDFLEGDYSWKTSWKLDTTRQYCFQK